MIRAPYKTVEDRGDSAPLHPGEVIREDLMPHFRLSIADLALEMGLSSSAVEDIIAERRPVSAELAKRLGAVFGLQPHYWLALQKQHDLWQSRFVAERERTSFRPLHLA